MFTRHRNQASRPKRCLLPLFALAAVLAVGSLRADGSDTARIQDLLEQAEAGNAAAQYELGMAYESGLDVEPDQDKALEYYYLAANQGHAAAQNEVGNSFHGQARFDEAFPWYVKSAEGGDFWGIHNLASMYERARGVPTDEAKAIVLYRQAADLGNADSMWNIAILYANGRQTPNDMYKACVWVHRANTGFKNSEGLDDRAQRVFRRTEDSIMQMPYVLTEDELVRCKTEADSWQPKGT